MAEIDANVVKVHAVSQHTRVLLEQAVERSHAKLRPHQVEILVEEPDAPAWFDPQLLGRVLRHLLENAARYTPPGSRIMLRSRRDGDRLEFCVEDNGPGIDAADLPLIFEKFYRGKRGAASARVPEWAWRLRVPSLPRMAEESKRKACRGRGLLSGSGCRWWRRNRQQQTDLTSSLI